ncbi:MAG: hypothetical protein NVS3B20_02270 [Polyangiales bacterium]
MRLSINTIVLTVSLNACAGHNTSQDEVAIAADQGASGNPGTAASQNGKTGAPFEGPTVYALPSLCGPVGKKYACNPITNEGCNSSRGEACDDDERGGFGCYPAPNEVALGGDCNVFEGPSCAAGKGCMGASASSPSGTCARYCCTSSECGGGKCAVIDPAFGTLGFCK